MPNTLVHFAVQGIANRTLFPSIDKKWVLLGCIVPDIPWIIQRAVQMTFPDIDPYLLRAWVIVQASFVFCLLLSAALSVLSERPKTVFMILLINSLFHLLLDACEIKPGTGVHIIAPISWELLTFSFVWPENIIITTVTVFGLLYTVFLVFEKKANPISLHLQSTSKASISVLFLFSYLLLPMFYINGPINLDNHSVKTLQDRDNRIGKEVFLDRDYYVPIQSGGVITTFAGEKIRIVGELPSQPAVVSIKGVFIDKDAIQATMVHENNAGFRDGASYVALLLLVILWIVSFKAERTINIPKDY